MMFEDVPEGISLADFVNRVPDNVGNVGWFGELAHTDVESGFLSVALDAHSCIFSKTVYRIRLSSEEFW